MAAVTPPVQILKEDGTLAAKAEEPALSDADLETMYRAMLLARTLDSRCMNLQRQGRIGFFGTSTGEEAAIIASGFAFEPGDWIFPALRQSGILLMRGYSLEKYFHHLFGTGESTEKGRSMPCHFSDREQNFFSWGSCMATQLPHAVGAAYAAKLRGESTVMAGYMGDGATSESDFHVAMNFAAVWKTPTVFVCQNNHWAISVPFHKQTASDGIAVKATAYGMPGVRVDGNDALAVYRETRKAVDRARAGGGPTLIELVTYRMQGHSSSDDPTRYRDPEEVAAWAARDPVTRFRTYLEARGIWSAAKEDAAVAEMNEAISRAIQVAEAASPPDSRSLVEDVFAEVPWHLEEQYRELRALRGD